MKREMYLKAVLEAVRVLGPGATAPGIRARVDRETGKRWCPDAVYLGLVELERDGLVEGLVPEDGPQRHHLDRRQWRYLEQPRLFGPQETRRGPGSRRDAGRKQGQ